MMKALFHMSKCYVFVGYDYAVKGYRLWDPTLWKIVISGDVTFDESSLLKSNVERIEQEQVSPSQRVQLEARSLGASGGR